MANFHIHSMLKRILFAKDLEEINEAFIIGKKSDYILTLKYIKYKGIEETKILKIHAVLIGQYTNSSIGLYIKTRDTTGAVQTRLGHK